MKTSKNSALKILAVAIVMTLPSLRAQSSAGKTSSGSDISVVGRWSVQVDKIDPGDVNIELAFRIAIYENLLEELSKTKDFRRVFRSNDRQANSVADLLILKTLVQSYTPGSETRRAVTTVSGATKLNVRTQLCRKDGQVVLERVVNGNVRFFGGNLRATHDLARNVAKTIEHSTLPEPAPSIAQSED